MDSCLQRPKTLPMANPKRKIPHEERLLRWGSAPDALGMDRLFSTLLEYFDVDPLEVAEEICWRRREQEVYKFCSRRTLSREPTMHLPLHSIPPEFPPVRLAVGTSKNADIIVERLLPDTSYKVEYSSNGSGANCFVRHPGAPQAYLASLYQKPMSEILEGLPDDRLVTHAQNFKKQGIKGIWLTFNSEIIPTSVKPVAKEAVKDIVSGPITFAGATSLSLADLINIEADSGGHKMFPRQQIEYAAIRLGTGSKTAIYIAVLPHASSRRPQFNGTGFFRDIGFDCYLGRASDIHAGQLAASMKTAKSITINSASMCERLGVKFEG